MNLSILEGDFFTLTASFYDEEDAAALPASIRYQIYCKTSGTLVRDWTDVVIDTEVEITVTSEDNVIQDDSHNWELKQLILEATITDEKKKSAKFEWRVENLRGVE